jgi:hypothetical protein
MKRSATSPVNFNVICGLTLSRDAERPGLESCVDGQEQ